MAATTVRNRSAISRARQQEVAPLEKGGATTWTLLASVFQTLSKIGFELVFLIDVSVSTGEASLREMVAGVRATARD